MNRDLLPVTAFVDPSGGNRSSVESLARRVLDLLLEASTSVARPSLLGNPSYDPGELFPLSGLSDEQVVERLAGLIESSAKPAHPGWVGHMNSIPTTASILGDLVAAGLDNNLLGVELSPARSSLEWRLGQRLAVEFGLGESGMGVLVGGGSIANLHALVVARDVQVARAAEPGEPCIFASELAHLSIRKASHIAGLGESGVVVIPTDADGRMCSASLVEAITASRDAGETPIAVVATAGTTSIGSIDPLNALADIAVREDLWLHVDAAYAGAAYFSQRYRRVLSGIERADSITFNPHKWFFVARNCAWSLFRRRQVLEEHFRMALPYLGSVVGGTPNISEYSPHGTQHADVLKLWLSLLHLGRDGLSSLVDEGIRFARILARSLEADPRFELAVNVPLNTVCFRPPHPEADRWVTTTGQKLLDEHGFFLSVQEFRGHKWLRFIPMNPFLEEDLVEKLLQILQREVQSLES